MMSNYGSDNWKLTSLVDSCRCNFFKHAIEDKLKVRLGCFFFRKKVI